MSFIPLNIRKGSAEEWQAVNPVLSDGEFGLVTGTLSYKIGDGITPWNTLLFAQLKGETGLSGENGTTGDTGLSAYQIAVNNGFIGTEIEWLASLKGLDGTNGVDGVDGQDGTSAYQIALNNGFVGTESEWLTSLKGQDGQDGTNSIINGANGLSAYQTALNKGFIGTETDWLSSFIGSSGVSGPDGVSGQDGLSAYQVALNGGFSGTQQEFSEEFLKPIKTITGGGVISVDSTDPKNPIASLNIDPPKINMDFINKKIDGYHIFHFQNHRATTSSIISAAIGGPATCTLASTTSRNVMLSVGIPPYSGFSKSGTTGAKSGLRFPNTSLSLNFSKQDIKLHTRIFNNNFSSGSMFVGLVASVNQQQYVSSQKNCIGIYRQSSGELRFLVNSDYASPINILTNFTFPVYTPSRKETFVLEIYTNSSGNVEMKLSRENRITQVIDEQIYVPPANYIPKTGLLYACWAESDNTTTGQTFGVCNATIEIKPK